MAAMMAHRICSRSALQRVLAVPNHRSFLGRIALLACVLLAFIGCSGKSSVSNRETCSTGPACGNTDAAGDAGAASGRCVNISGAGPEPWFDLTVNGTQFDADEGARMRIVVATQSPDRVGIGDVTIINGAFTLFMPQVLNSGYYTGISLYVDRNGDNICETAEDVWDFGTPAVASNLQYDVTPDKWCGGNGCLLRSQQTGAACLVGTGQTDLTQPLPCRP